MSYVELKYPHLANYIVICSIFICSLLITTLTSAQSAVVTNGINVANEYGVVTSSIGYMFYASRTNLLIISEGLQQANDGNKINKAITIKLGIFPNPTPGNVYFKVEDFNYENLRYKVSSILGNLIGRGNITDNNTFFSMVNLPNGVYIISVFRGESEIQNFKIIKSN